MNDRHLKILLIEDNPGDVRLIREMLAEAKNGPFDLECADRLSTGLERLAEGDINVVLLDLGLPDCQGLDTLSKVLTEPPGVPVIVVLTALDDEQLAVKAVREGAQDYLVKGQVDGNLLVRAMHYAIERQRTENVLRRRNHELALLNRVGQELVATLDLQQVAELLLQTVTEVVGAQGASLWLWDEEHEGWLTCRVTSYHKQNHSPVNLRLRPGQGIAGWVAHKGESIIVVNTQDDERFFRGIDEQTGFHTTSLLAVPLRIRKAVVGVLEVVNKWHDAFDEDDLALVETLATSASIAIDNARMVEMLRRHTVELQARNEDLDAFAHTAAHDLKGPLGYMVGFAEVLEQNHDILSEEERYRSLRTIIRSGRKMSNIIDELLLLAELRKMKVEMRPLDMATIVAEAQERLAYLIEEHQAEITLPERWPVALGYGPWVEEVWVNYLSNALKYGGQPPRVELGTSHPPVCPIHGEEEVERRVCFWVRDNGPGLTPEDQARLFTPFTRLDQARAKGHGLGLSIVRRIVEKLGGQVGVKSEAGQGSVFSFTLREATTHPPAG